MCIQTKYSNVLELKVENILRIVCTDVFSEHEDEYLRWYSSEHERLLLKIPGVIWTYRGINLHEHGSKYMYLYFCKDKDVLESDIYKSSSQTEWAKRIKPFLKHFSAINYNLVKAGPLITQIGLQDIFHIERIRFNEAKPACHYKKFYQHYLTYFDRYSNIKTQWICASEINNEYLIISVLENAESQFADLKFGNDLCREPDFVDWLKDDYKVHF